MFTTNMGKSFARWNVSTRKQWTFCLTLENTFWRSPVSPEPTRGKCSPRTHSNVPTGRPNATPTALLFPQLGSAPAVYQGGGDTATRRMGCLKQVLPLRGKPQSPYGTRGDSRGVIRQLDIAYTVATDRHALTGVTPPGTPHAFGAFLDFSFSHERQKSRLRLNFHEPNILFNHRRHSSNF